MTELGQRLAARLAVALAPFDEAVRIRPWRASVLAGLIVAVIAAAVAAVRSGGVQAIITSAVGDFLGVVPTLRIVLWLIEKGYWPLYKPPTFPP